MKTYLNELFTNRFGIVLATINVCALAVLFRGHPFGSGEMFVALINVPAILVGALFSRVVTAFGISRFTYAYGLEEIVMFAAVVIQWLVIADFARRVAPSISQFFAARRS